MKPELCNFGRALQQLKDGLPVRRATWSPWKTIRLQTPNNKSLMTQPYLYIEYLPRHPGFPFGARVPWTPTQIDLMAEDWAIIENEETDHE